MNIEGKLNVIWTSTVSQYTINISECYITCKYYSIFISWYLGLFLYLLYATYAKHLFILRLFDLYLKDFFDIIPPFIILYANNIWIDSLA